MESSKKPIINISELQFADRPAAMGETPEGFGAQMAFIAPLIGGKLLGYNVTKVLPGKKAFPYHNHHVNEEMFFVLEGTGELRFGSETYPIQKGDIISCPPGGPEVAHQMKNTGTEDMLVLSISTKMGPEIAEYPDSNKFGVMGEPKVGPDGKPEQFRFLGRKDQSLSYWDGEQ